MLKWRETNTSLIQSKVLNQLPDCCNWCIADSQEVWEDPVWSVHFFRPPSADSPLALAIESTTWLQKGKNQSIEENMNSLIWHNQCINNFPYKCFKLLSWSSNLIQPQTLKTLLHLFNCASKDWKDTNSVTRKEKNSELIDCHNCNWLRDDWSAKSSRSYALIFATNHRQ